MQVIKPLLLNMHQTDTYLQKKLDDLHIQNALREILTQSNCIGQWICDDPYSRHKPVVVYATRAEVLDVIQQQLPISAVVLTQSNTGVCVQNSNGIVDVYPVAWSADGEYICGLWYCSVTIAAMPSSVFASRMAISSSGPYDYALLIASYQLSSYSTTSYAAITMNWLVHDADMTYKLYHLTRDAFHDYMS